MTIPYPPPWQDKATLCEHVCIGDTTVDDWVRRGLLPPPRKRGGKLMWKWETVDLWLDHGGDPEHTHQDNDRVVRMREAMQGASRRG